MVHNSLPRIPRCGHWLQCTFQVFQALRSLQPTQFLVCHRRWHRPDPGVEYPHLHCTPRVLGYGPGLRFGDHWFQSFHPICYSDHRRIHSPRTAYVSSFVVYSVHLPETVVQPCHVCKPLRQQHGVPVLVHASRFVLYHTVLVSRELLTDR